MQQTLHPLELPPQTPLWPWLVLLLSVLLIVWHWHRWRHPVSMVLRQLALTNATLPSVDALRHTLRRLQPELQQLLASEIEALDQLRFAPTAPSDAELTAILQRIDTLLGARR